jgi:adenylate cyclase
MKRKIAAIFAADIAGYSRLVAEDEEETLRRLSSYRAVIDDFIAKAPGRIFNTAGDAVLAEFASAVDAVRCAIDIQESLRTRNRAYPPSRQMNFRIGITIGDVVERNGDLLGDGVNIAARLEGLAEPGGICVSHSVYEQVLNKLSVGFSDIGQQQVKNIPRPVHAYVVTTHAPGDQVVTPKVNKGGKRTTAIAVTIALIIVGALVVATYTYLTPTRAPNPDKVATPSSAPPAAAQVTAPAVPAQSVSPATQPTSTAPAAPAQDAPPASKQIPPALRLSDPAKVDCSARTAGARMFATEPPRGQGALGYKEKVYVNDGQCPVGYIKEITGGSRRLDVPRGVRCVQC